VSAVLESILSLAVPASTPLLLACLGAIISERSGVLNLGIEGTMAVGALTAFMTAGTTGSPWLGLLVSMVAGMVFVSLLAIFSVSLKSDQVITGVMLSLLGVALTTYFGRPWTGRSVETFDTVVIPVVGQSLVELPIVGRALFQNTPIDYLTIVVVPAVWYFLFRTDIGMEIIAVGDDPETADTMSIDVTRTRYLCVLLSGLLAGAAGAAVSLSFAELWTANLINNRGWIAVALVIVAQWNPVRAVGGAYLFGLIYAMQFRVQSIDFGTIMPLSAELGGVYNFVFHPVIMSTYPYVITILVLVLTTRTTRKELSAPQALVKPYMREDS
jgi:simple sugar transport system permease protein